MIGRFLCRIGWHRWRVNDEPCLGGLVVHLQALRPKERAHSMGMIERVARALCNRHYRKRFNRTADDPIVKNNEDANWDMFVKDARTAIVAMLEPTELIITHGKLFCQDEEMTVKCWEVMITAALEEA